METKVTIFFYFLISCVSTKFTVFNVHVCKKKTKTKYKNAVRGLHLQPIKGHACDI